MLATTTGLNAATEKVPRTSSSANITPAMGALNAAEIPAAAPHASITLRSRGRIARKRPEAEPSAAPGAAEAWARARRVFNGGGMGQETIS